MIKILHAADLHLDSPFSGRGEAASARLRRELLAVPDKLAALCKKENCDLFLLAGDVFDGAYTGESLRSLRQALEEAAVPVFISPGNHDFYCPDSPWRLESWPSNVHIFTSETVRSMALPQLDCRIYGAGFSAMDCPPLLEGFAPEGGQRWHIGLFHGDAVQANSPYDPISRAQVEASGLDYLALGHIHRCGSFRAGKTLCAWPGCPMGRGFDELEEKGALVVTLEQQAQARFVPLDTPRFFEREAAVTESAAAAVAAQLPAAGSEDFYRITLTGTGEKPDLPALYSRFSAFPNLELRDRTQPPVDIWQAAGEDSLEGLYFKMLRQCYEEETGEARQIARLAAQISRDILDGNEVRLP